MNVATKLAVALAERFEREIREQPDVWEALARSSSAQRLAAALDGPVLFVGSGSSLFAAQVGALALRRRGVDAQALAATEAHADKNAYQHRTVVALSQSGRSTDVLAALDGLHPRRVIALTNTADSPLGARADLVIDVSAGPERAIPATKSVSSTIAVLLSCASLLSGESARDADALIEVARQVREWLGESGVAPVIRAATAIAALRDVIVLGTDYGAPIAREAALKFKESTYMHAEGFEAGEFRHGSAAMVDGNAAVIGILDDDALAVVGRPLEEASRAGLRYAIGSRTIDGVERLGAVVADPYNSLAWLVAIQVLALHVSRARGIDADSPRGLTKAIAAE